MSSGIVTMGIVNPMKRLWNSTDKGLQIPKTWKFRFEYQSPVVWRPAYLRYFMLVYLWPWGQRLNLTGRRILYLDEWRTDKKTWSHCALCVEAPIWMIHLGFIIQPKFQDLREAYRFDEGSLEILGSCVTVWTMHRLKVMLVMDSNVFLRTGFTRFSR